MCQSPQIKIKAAALIQITVFLLIPSYFLIPVFGGFIPSNNHGTVCRGDHGLCGCPLDRILNHTCCCFKSSELAKKRMNHHKMGFKPFPDIDRSLRFVCPTCSNHADVLPGFVEKILFLRFAPTTAIPCFLLVFLLTASGNGFQSWSEEPPDPPPKLTLA